MPDTSQSINFPLGISTPSVTGKNNDAYNDGLTIKTNPTPVSIPIGNPVGDFDLVVANGTAINGRYLTKLTVAGSVAFVSMVASVYAYTNSTNVENTITVDSVSETDKSVLLFKTASIVKDSATNEMALKLTFTLNSPGATTASAVVDAIGNPAPLNVTSVITWTAPTNNSVYMDVRDRLSALSQRANGQGISLNSLMKPCVVACNPTDLASTPNGSSGVGTCIVFGSPDNRKFLTQNFHDINSGKIYTRNMTSDGVTWGNWTQVLTSAQGTAAKSVNLVEPDSNGNISIDTDDIGEGSTNEYFTQERVLDTPISALDVNLTGKVADSDTLRQAFGKVQNQLNAKDKTDGYVGLSGYKVNIKDAATGNVVSFLQSTSTSSVTWTLPASGGTLTNTDDVAAMIANTPITGNGAVKAGTYTVSNSSVVTVPDLTNPIELSFTSASNAPSLPATITTSDGWTVTTGFSVGSTKTIAPVKFGTPHGWWGSLAMTPKVLTQASYSTNASTSAFIQSSIRLSANCVVMVIGDTNSSNTIVSIVAVDPTTGSIGNVISLNGRSSYGNCLYPVGTTGFVFIFTDSSTSKSSVYAATMSGANGLTISGAITLLSSSTALGISDSVQLSTGTTSSFLVAMNNTTTTSTPDLIAFSVTGSTVTLGTPIASGGAISNNWPRLMAVNSTTALMAYCPGSSSPNSNLVRVVSVSGLTLSLGAASSTAAGGSIVGQNRVILYPFNTNTFLMVTQDYNTSTTSWFNIVTVSGTTANIGTGVSVTSFSPTWPTRNISNIYIGKGLSQWQAERYIYQIDSTHLLMCCGTGQALITNNAGTPVVGSVVGSAGTFASDPANSGVYLLASSTYQKITWNGSAVSYGAAVAGTPNSIFSATLNDAGVNYGGTWYAWTNLPAAMLPLSIDKYVNANSTTSFITIYGNFS